MLGPRASPPLESLCPEPPEPSAPSARILLAAAALGGPAALPAAAADGPQMDARVLLQGHARLGSWMAIDVRLQNEGTPVVGELRLQGGAQGGTRFSVPGRPPEPFRQALHAVRATAVVRPADRGRARRRRPADPPSEGRVHDPRSHPAHGRCRRRPARGHRGRHPAAGSPEQREPDRRPARRRGPARPHRGLVGARPPGLAGRRLERAHDGRRSLRCAAGSRSAAG